MKNIKSCVCEQEILILDDKAELGFCPYCMRYYINLKSNKKEVTEKEMISIYGEIRKNNRK